MKKLFRKRNFNINFLGMRKIGYSIAFMLLALLNSKGYKIQERRYPQGQRL